MPNFRGVRFTNAHETLLWAKKSGARKYNLQSHAMKALNDDLQMRSDWQLPFASGKERLRVHGVKAHPTQKPRHCYTMILASSGRRPGAGSLLRHRHDGACQEAAEAMIGIEQEPTYASLARERIEAIDRACSEKPSCSNAADRPRVAFAAGRGRTCEANQLLYFGGKSRIKAKVRPMERSLQRIPGSIHQVGRKITNAPATAEHWYYEDDQGERSDQRSSPGILALQTPA